MRLYLWRDRSGFHMATRKPEKRSWGYVGGEVVSDLVACAILKLAGIYAPPKGVAPVLYVMLATARMRETTTAPPGAERTKL